MRMVRRRGAFAGSVQGSFRSAGGAGRASKVWRPHARPEEAQASSPTFVARGTAAAAPARAAPPRPDRARDGRRGGVLRVPDLPGVGRRRGRRLGGGRAAAADRRGVSGGAGGLLAAGAILVMREMLPAVRPFRSGGLCLFLALTLGLAAGTLGLGPGGEAVRWDPDWVRPRGGLVGEGLYWGISTALGVVGAHIVALFLFLAAVLLLTGASVAGVVKATTDSFTKSESRVRAAVQRRRATEELAALELGEPHVSRGTPPADTVVWEGDEPEPFEPHEPEASERARGGGAPAPRRGPGDRRAGRHAGGGRSHAAGPLPAVDHRLARLRVDGAGRGELEALLGGGGAAGHGGAGEDRRPAGRGARPLRRRGAGDRQGRRAAHHALRAAAGAGDQGRQGRAAQGRPRVRAGGVRHPHPRADPGQAGGRGRGAERAAPDRPPRRRLPGAAARLVAADGVARQGRGGPRDRRRPREDAAPAGGRHDRGRQVGLRERDALLDPAARHAARRPDGAGRPQAGRAQPLRLDPAPADAGDHVAAQGRHRSAEPRARDGAAVLVHVAGADADAERT